MPYSFPDRIPRPAKNWSPSRQRKCISAANAVLDSGGSEESAIFACLHNARTKQEDDEYDRVSERAALDLQHLVELYFTGKLTLNQFQSSFQEKLKEHYSVILMLDMNRDITEEDINYLNKKLNETYDYLNGFVEDLSNDRITQQRALWRAGLYAFPRSVFVAGSIPPDIVELMGVLPGDDCLGGFQCKCSLQVEFDSDGTAYVYWVVDPLAEHCVVCLGHAAESPYVFSPEEVAGALNR